ncbi:hypothetical protein BH11ACT5_BH11ACT5_03910 [soil metagenome]
MRRPFLVLATVVATTLALSGCDVLAPTRDSDGKIVKALEMPSIEAWVGDCFSFVDGSNLALATVVPCAEQHTHIVVGRGTLTQKRIDYFETLQLAVISACKDRITLYTEQQEDDPQPEYIVSTETSPEGVATMHYSCLVTSSAG